MSRRERRRGSGVAATDDRPSPFLRNLVEALSELTLSDVSRPLERQLEEVARGLASLGEAANAPHPLLSLGSRRLAEGAGPWRRYALGAKERLPQEAAAALEESLARHAEGSAAADDGRLTRFLLREVLDEIGVPAEKAAGLFLDDLRDRLASEGAKRFASWTPPRSLKAVGSSWFSLTKTHPDLVSASKGDKATGAVERGLAGEVSEPTRVDLLYPGGQLVVPDAVSGTETGSLPAKAKGLAATDAVGEAREAVRLVERLLDLARRYTVDLVDPLERYREIAYRILREAQASRAQQQWRNDKQAIEHALAQLDSRQVARDLAALPLYLYRAAVPDAEAVATALIPSLANPSLQSSFARLCLHLLRSPGAEPPADDPRALPGGA